MRGLRLVLFLLASGIVIVGVFQAIDKYRLAIAASEVTLAYYELLRGLVWNVGTYTMARMLVWWAKVAHEPWEE